MNHSKIVNQAILAFERLNSGKITREDVDAYKIWYLDTLLKGDGCSVGIEEFISECEDKLNGKA